MRRNLDLIIILTLSVLVCGVLYLLYTDTAEYSMPKNDNIVMLQQGVGHRRMAPRRTEQGVTWAPENMSGRASSSSSRSVRVSPQNYRRSSMQATTTNSSLVSSSRSLMSDGASNSGVSIVGGNNASFGRTAEANRSQSLAYGGGVGYPGVNMPSMRSANPAVASSPSYISVGPSASSPSQSYIYGRSYSSRSIYGSSSVMGGSRVQQKAPPVIGGGGTNEDGETVNGSWLNWLDNKYGGSFGKNGGTKGFTYGDAYLAWEEMCNSWNDGMGPAPTWDDFLAWLQAGGDTGYNKGNHYYKFVPVGDIVPLFLLAFMYMVMVVLRKRKEAIK